MGAVSPSAQYRGTLKTTTHIRIYSIYYYTADAHLHPELNDLICVVPIYIFIQPAENCVTYAINAAISKRTSISSIDPSCLAII